MVDGSCDGLIRSYPQGVLDRREAGNGYVRVMIVGDAGTWGERGQDIEKMNIASSTASESVVRGRQIIQEQGLTFLSASI
jgi:hypothetical protein